MEALITKMNAEVAALQGSGWVWLSVDKDLKRLVVETTANQESIFVDSWKKATTTFITADPANFRQVWQW